MILSYRCFIILIIFSILAIFAPVESAAGKIKVVATLTILEDFVKNIGGDRVDVKSLLSGLESEHTYTPKPSDIVAVREAGVLIKVGLGLEVWVDSLIRNAGNDRLVIITTSEGIPVISGEEADSDGHDSHHGNPHVWLDPERAKIMIGHITDALVRIDPEGSRIYMANQTRYFREIDALQKNIEERLKHITSRKIITHHPAWPYFAERFDLQIVDNIQTQVGTEPSARHIADIVEKVKKENVRVIVSEPQLNQKIPEAIADETGARMIVITPIPGGLPGTETYIGMMDYIADQLAASLK